MSMIRKNQLNQTKVGYQILKRLFLTNRLEDFVLEQILLVAVLFFVCSCIFLYFVTPLLNKYFWFFKEPSFQKSMEPSSRALKSNPQIILEQTSVPVFISFAGPQSKGFVLYDFKTFLLELKHDPCVFSFYASNASSLCRKVFLNLLYHPLPF